MRSFAAFLLIMTAFAGCARLPTTIQMERDVKEAYVEKFKKAEDDRIRRWERFYPPERRDDEYVRQLFQRQDMSVYDEHMETLKIVGLQVDYDAAEGTAEFVNTYGSVFQVRFSYRRRARGWEFVNAIDEKTLRLSDEEKREYLRVNIVRAIVKFAQDCERYPQNLQELVPRYIRALPPGTWDYDPFTGALNS